MRDVSAADRPGPDGSGKAPPQPTEGTAPAGQQPDAHSAASNRKASRDSGRYEAFVSYSHAADGKFAPVLQPALQGFAKPWYRRRALHVFRDKTSLSATPELWPTIEHVRVDLGYC